MRALFVYANNEKTGLSAKAKKIEEGFRDAGYDVDAVYFSSGQGQGGRACEWLKANYSFIRSIATTRYDVIYMRYAYYFGPMYAAAWIWRRQFQIDVNSNVQGELAQSGQRLRAKCDAVIMWMVCRTAKRVHVVSRQLERMYRKSYPTAEVVFNPNFVVSEEKPSDRVLGEHNAANLVFLGNAAQAWHGIDKFIRKIIVGNRRFAETCRLHLVGRSTAEIDGLITEHGLQEVVHVHGFLTGDAKVEILKDMDIGIGCFDLGVIGLTETTSIKNGEYLHSGLALLLGYEDPACPSELSFVGKLALDGEDPWLDFESYIRRIRAVPDLRRNAHEYARTHLLVNHYIDKIIAS